MSERLRVLIVDDEPLARERLRTLLSGDPDIEIVGECGDGRQAVQVIRNTAPDLVFLDVQMPLLDGFEVADHVGVEHMPPVIFVTAYDEYALRAFDVHAVDYLLKPFDRERFEQALARAKRRSAPEMAHELLALLTEMRSERAADRRLVIKSRGRITIVEPRELDWIEAAGNYVRLHAGGNSHLMRETMVGMAERLPAEDFTRVSRSAIIRIDRIKHLRRRSHGEYLIELRDGTRVRSTRGYSDRLAALLDD